MLGKLLKRSSKSKQPKIIQLDDDNDDDLKSELNEELNDDLKSEDWDVESVLLEESEKGRLEPSSEIKYGFNRQYSNLFEVRLILLLLVILTPLFEINFFPSFSI